MACAWGGQAILNPPIQITITGACGRHANNGLCSHPPRTTNQNDTSTSTSTPRTTWPLTRHIQVGQAGQGQHLVGDGAAGATHQHHVTLQGTRK